MSRWRWFRSGWDTAISLPPRIFIRIWTTLPRFLQQKQCCTGLEWVQIRKMTLKKVWFLSRTGRFLSCYGIVKLKNSAFCIKKRYRALKKAHCTVDWRSIRDLNSGGATNALSHFECDPFDLLGNAPYSNPPKSSPEKGEKSKYLIVENSGFLTMSRYKINGNFQNACLISSAPSYDLLGNAPCSGFLPDTKLV